MLLLTLLKLVRGRLAPTWEVRRRGHMGQLDRGAIEDQIQSISIFMQGLRMRPKVSLGIGDVVWMVKSQGGAVAQVCNTRWSCHGRHFPPPAGMYMSMHIPPMLPCSMLHIPACSNARLMNQSDILSSIHNAFISEGNTATSPIPLTLLPMPFFADPVLLSL